MKKIPKKTIERVLLYIRILEGLIKEKRYFVCSSDLAQMTGFSSAQVRKDISNFGKIGTPRIGYQTVELRDTLRKLVLQKKEVFAVLFGVGNLGLAILKYPGFQKERIKITAAFDNDSRKIGQRVNNIPIYGIKQVASIIRKTRSLTAILAVPKEKAQEVASLIVPCGIKGIINFTPTTIKVPKAITVRDIDLTIEFLSLFCDMQHANKK